MRRLLDTFPHDGSLARDQPRRGSEGVPPPDMFGVWACGTWTEAPHLKGERASDPVTLLPHVPSKCFGSSTLYDGKRSEPHRCGEPGAIAAMRLQTIPLGWMHSGHAAHEKAVEPFWRVRLPLAIQMDLLPGFTSESRG